MRITHFQHSSIAVPLLLTRVRERIRYFLAVLFCSRPWFVVFIVIAGCGQVKQLDEVQPDADLAVDVPTEGVDDSPVIQVAAQDPVEMDSVSGDVVFKTLTSNSWSNAPTRERPFGFCPVGEGDSEFRFLASGEYQHQWHSLASGETVIKASGRWMLQQGHDKKWLACLDSGERHPITLFGDGRIQLDGWKYPWQKLEPETNTKSLLNLDVIIFPDEVKKRNGVLTSREWHRANDVNLDRFPAKIVFREDFTYMAYSATGREFPIGTWYATSQAASASGPRDPDGEGEYLKNYGSYFRIEIDHADQLIIESAPYDPKERIGSKGTIWQFGGYSNIRVRVDYDVPIRCGVPCQFDIHFSEMPEMTLQRFSITKEYDHGYRRPDGSIAQVEEIAALDLMETMMHTGESKSFKVNVTFPESGDRSYYLNALIRGATQHWDEREAMTFRILEPE